jgi:hypothetical protein
MEEFAKFFIISELGEIWKQVVLCCLRLYKWLGENEKTLKIPVRITDSLSGTRIKFIQEKVTRCPKFHTRPGDGMY